MGDIRVGLAGLGQIGSAVYKNLSQRYNLIKKRHGISIIITRVAEINREVFKKKTSKYKTFKPKFSTLKEIATDPDIDIVIELMGGYEVAADFMKDSIRNGKHVITANKACLAKYGNEILSLAAKHSVNVGYEASVGGFVPFLSTLEKRYTIERIRSIVAINNGSTNKMLTEMFKRPRFDFRELTKEFIKDGILEADPSLDIDGHDSMHKLILTARRAFRTDIGFKEKNMYREGISRITIEDIKYAKQLNQTIKLLSIAEKDKDEIRIRVHPVMLSSRHPFARINDTINYFRIKGDLSDETGVDGRGAGPDPTSSVVIDNLIEIMKNPKARLTPDPKSYKNRFPISPIDKLKGPYYVRFVALNRPGVLHQITGVLRKYKLNISAVEQMADSRDKPVHIFMLLDKDSIEKNVRKAVEKIDKLSVITGKSFYIRMMYQDE